MTEPKYLRPGEVAAMFGVAPKTVNAWGRKGWLTVSLTPGGHHRYLRAEVLAMLGRQAGR